MKMSQQLFVPQKNPPARAETINHQLLVQAGFVRQTMAGVYTYSHLGLTVLNKIAQIVREEMLAIGSQEVLMPALHPSENWKKTGGWETIDVLFKIKSQTHKEYALGQSHEEIVTPLLIEVIKSYKDLPQSVFQIQWKFRDELRAKSGILRGREFLMKDMYSFHPSQADFDAYYEKVKKAYLQVFKRLTLPVKVTEASGGNFTDKISYEYMVLTVAGEDDIFYCEQCDYCINAEISLVGEGDQCPKCQGKLKKSRASEAGNIFDLGQKFSQAFKMTYRDQNNQTQMPTMGCYGIGISRNMGIIVEKYHDQNGIIWPESVAPALIYLIGLKDKEKEAEQAYHTLQKQGYSVIWDDRGLSPGVKLMSADLIGCPLRLILSPKNKDKWEVKKRESPKLTLLSPDEFLQKYQAQN